MGEQSVSGFALEQKYAALLKVADATIRSLASSILRISISIFFEVLNRAEFPRRIPMDILDCCDDYEDPIPGLRIAVHRWTGNWLQ